MVDFIQLLAAQVLKFLSFFFFSLFWPRLRVAHTFVQSLTGLGLERENKKKKE
jgi:hypothetical protein